MSYSAHFYLIDIRGLADHFDAIQKESDSTEREFEIPDRAGYWLEEVCRTLGEYVAVPELQDIRGLDMSGPLEWLASGSPIAIPKHNNFPFIGFMPRHHIPAAIEIMEAILESDSEDWKIEVCEGMLSLYDSAISKGKDIVSLYY